MVGNGSTINVWTDPWMGDRYLRVPPIKNRVINIDLRVIDLTNPYTCSWDILKLQELFYNADVEVILKIKPAVNRADFWS